MPLPGLAVYTKFTDSTRKLLYEAASAGMTRKLACQYAGISKQTFANWFNQGRDDIEAEVESDFATFVETFEIAEAEGAVKALQAIKNAFTGENADWKAAAWYLARVHPHDYGKMVKTEHTGAGGGPIKITSIEVAVPQVSVERQKFLEDAIDGDYKVIPDPDSRPIMDWRDDVE